MADLLDAARRHRLGLFSLAVLLGLAWIGWSARGALPAFLVGLALAFVLDPPVTLLQRAGIPRWAGVLVLYAVVVGLAWGIGAFVIPPIAGQTRDFLDQLPRFGALIGEWERGLNAWYLSLPLPAELRSFLDQAIQSGQAQLIELLRAIIGPTLGTLLRTVTFLFGLVVVPVWLFFVLKDREGLPGAVAGALPAAWREDALNVLGLLARVGGKWVRGQLLLGAAVFAATAIGFGILTLVGFSEFGKFTLVLALIAGVLEWFPVIGPVVAAIPAALIGLSISPGDAIAAIVVSTAVQQLENNLLVPKVMGDAVELHPAVLILGLVGGAALFGLLGAILAAPVISAARDLHRYTFRRLDGEPAGVAYRETVRRGGARGRPRGGDAESRDEGEKDGPAEPEAVTDPPAAAGPG